MLSCNANHLLQAIQAVVLLFPQGCVLRLLLNRTTKANRFALEL
jgi:hypothetical protein